ncbi:hypothetical protein WJX81_002100 [Elliptochloris bilobata]|uniref:Uncharacterized protein n=1 Tax=Elliptochloris bilobata TaxID=381761 RepID=A0AAW1QI56_9CHLO
MQHADYPSGSACYCAAYGKAMQDFLGNDELGFSIMYKAGICCRRNLLAFRPQRRHSEGARVRQLWSRMAPRAAITDTPPWTLDQIAGLAFGAVMLASVYVAYKADVVVARQQRRELGLCEACGGLNEPETCRDAGCPRQRASGQSGA